MKSFPLRARAKYLLGGLLSVKADLTFTANTFLVWEPCSYSHGEVVPGYAKYLLDLGYDVTVFMTPERIDEGLFERFQHPRLTLNRLAQPMIVRLFAEKGLQHAKGILITTARKIGHRDSYATERGLFSNRSKNQRLLLVDHDVRKTADNGSLRPSIITLRGVHYRNAETTVVNPHYFGDVQPRAKNATTTFVSVGAMRSRRRNKHLLLAAAEDLHAAGVKNFRIVVVGRGSLQGIAAHLRPYFDIRGRLDFAGLYSAVESADFFLNLLDPDNPLHDRYLTTGTSGNFQLIFGFNKPCLLAEKFAPANRFNTDNSILYTTNADLWRSMRSAIEMPLPAYEKMQQSLRHTADSLYRESLENLRSLIASDRSS